MKTGLDSQDSFVRSTVSAEPGSMRAAVLVDAGRVEMTRVERPVPAPDQVRIRLEGCGVCASNIPAFEGREWFQYPLPPGELGHEGWGVVDACGDGVTDVRVGQRVAALSFRAYADYDVAAASAVVPLPPSLDGLAFPGEAIGCAMNIFRRAEIRAGHTVAIVGAGFLGALLTRLAAEAGAHVVAISRAPFSLRQARTMGAAEALSLDDHEAIGHLHGGCERVIEATGKPGPLDLAGQLIGFGGRLVIAGFHQDGPRTVDMQNWNWRGIDVINAHERDPQVALAGLCAAVDAFESGRLDPMPLITHRYPLAELGAALSAVRDRPEGFTKAVVLTDAGSHE